MQRQYISLTASLLATVMSLTTVAGCQMLRSAPDATDIVDELPKPAKAVVDYAIDRPPSQRRDWRPELSVLPFVEFKDDQVTVHNVRRCRWRSKTDYDVKHDDWTFTWDQVRAVDFIVVPFPDSPLLAHTMLSFDIGDGRYLALSVEARLEADEEYSLLGGAARQFDLIYVLGDEEDLIGLRAEVRQDEVYLYRSVATPAQAAAILRSVLLRTNQLVKHPEFYDSLTNSCVTNIADHISPFVAPSLTNDWRLMMPGHSDKLAYDLKLIDTTLPFEQVRRRAFVSLRARQHLGEPDFSLHLRR